MSSAADRGAESSRITCRPRFNVFLEFRSQHRKRGWQDDGPKNPLDLSSRGHRRRAVQSLLSEAEPVATVGLSPKWMGSVEQIHDIIGLIKTKMAELKQKHADHIRVRFGAVDDDEQQIEVLTASITKMYQNGLMKVDQIGKGEKLRPEEQVMKENIQRALAAELQELSAEFRASQESYLQELTARKERTQRKMGPGNGAVSQEPAIMIGEDEGGGLLQQQAMMLEGNDVEFDELVERDRELKNVAKSIRELSDIFRDLAILVIDQGTALDRIDCNLENTQVHMEQAIVHLKASDDLSKGARLRNTILVLLVLIIILTIIIIVRVARR